MRHRGIGILVVVVVVVEVLMVVRAFDINHRSLIGQTIDL